MHMYIGSKTFELKICVVVLSSPYLMDINVLLDVVYFVCTLKLKRVCTTVQHCLNLRLQLHCRFNFQRA